MQGYFRVQLQFQNPRVQIKIPGNDCMEVCTNNILIQPKTTTRPGKLVCQFTHSHTIHEKGTPTIDLLPLTQTFMLVV